MKLVLSKLAVSVSQGCNLPRVGDTTRMRVLHVCLLLVATISYYISLNMYFLTSTFYFLNFMWSLKVSISLFFFFLLGFLPEIKGASFEWCSTGAVIDILCSFLLGIIVSL